MPIIKSRTKKGRKRSLQEEKRLKEGQEYIGQREKLASQENVSSKRAAQMIASELPETPESKAERILTEQAAYTEATQKLIQQEIARQDEEKLKKDMEERVLVDQPKQISPEERAALEPKPTTIKERFQQQVGREAAVSLDVKGMVEAGQEEFMPIAADVIDVVRKGITGAKPLKVTTASNELDNAIRALEGNIEDVRTNNLSPDAAYSNIRRSEIALSKLAGVNSQTGKAYLRYWSGGGAEMDAEIILYQERIQRLKDDLESAIQQSKINQARAKFGI